MGSFFDQSTIMQFYHYRQHGSFLNGKPWSEQPIALLAEFEIIKKAIELNSKKFDQYTVGDRDLIEWLSKEE